MGIAVGCRACRDGGELGFDFTMAFQPIVDVRSETVWGYEALVRGLNGEGAPHILSQVTDDNRYKFDQAARVKAIELASLLFPLGRTRLSINFMPNAVYEPKACIRASLAAAERVGFDRTRIMFEFTENEKMSDVAHVQHIVSEYRRIGFLTALDDFGAGYAGLGLLAKFQTDLIKIDMDLVRGIDGSRPKRVIIAGIVAMAAALEITVLAEGVETAEEAAALKEAGISIQQGYFYGKPTVERILETPSRREAVEV